MCTKMSSLYIFSERNIWRLSQAQEKERLVPNGTAKKTVNLNMSKNTVRTHEEADGANKRTPPTKSHTKVDEDGFFMIVVINGSPNRQLTGRSNKLPDTSMKTSFTILQQEDDDQYDTVDFTSNETSQTHHHEMNNHHEAGSFLSSLINKQADSASHTKLHRLSSNQGRLQGVGGCG
jgi:hypothetical protein